MRIVFALTFLFLSTHAFAQQNLSDALATCANINSVLERLNCFDTLTKKNTTVVTPQTSSSQPIEKLSPQAANNPTATASPDGEWMLTSGKNPLDDKPIVSGGLVADAGANASGDLPILMLRCKSGRFQAYIGWNAYLGLDSVSVTYRPDDRPAKTQKWNISTTHETVFAPQANEFLNDLVHTKQLTVRVIPYSANPITSTFDLTGIQRVNTSIREVCKLR